MDCLRRVHTDKADSVDLSIYDLAVVVWVVPDDLSLEGVAIRDVGDLP